MSYHVTTSAACGSGRHLDCDDQVACPGCSPRMTTCACDCHCADEIDPPAHTSQPDAQPEKGTEQ